VLASLVGRSSWSSGSGGRACLLAALLGAAPLSAGAAVVGGITIDDRARVGGAELTLNGAGLRKRLVYKVYVVALYLGEKTSSADAVRALPGPKRISITLLRNLKAQAIADSLDEGIRQDTSPAEQKKLKGRLAELNATVLSLRHSKKGEVVAFDWLPASGTVLLVNGVAKGKAIPGDDFYRALLGIWLGDKPTSSSLKKALLGQ
jgi:hypothetical protein